MFDMPGREPIADLPTPLERLDRLTEMWGGPRIWVKRDDRTGFGVSGNKVRKLEFHVRAARRAGANVLMTCGAAQSNHCRATALVAARLGFECVVYLRTPDGEPPSRVAGNHLLVRLAGADVRFVDPAWWNDRNRNMAAAAEDLRRRGIDAWVIPEGASDGLGMWGYVRAAAEAAGQLHDAGVERPIHWHAASSGGTTAGLAAHALREGAPGQIVAVSVSDPVPGLAARIESIWGDAFGDDAGRLDIAEVELRDDYVGRGYGLATADELAVQRAATAATGLIFDPAYTGKALYGLYREITAGRFGPDDDVVFWHTGGGFAALAFDYAEVLDGR